MPISWPQSNKFVETRSPWTGAILHAHLRIHTASRYSGGGSRRRTGQDRATRRGCSVRRRGHNTHRSDEAERRNARPADRHQSFAARQDRSNAQWRPKDWRHSSKFRSRASSDGTTRLCSAVTGDSQWGLCATSQYGDDCRQPAPANAVHVLPRCSDALQQARARNRLPGDHR